MLYIIKIKGTTKIPDFVQIRDSEMTLIAYFRLNQVEKGLEKNGLQNETDGITHLLKDMPYGKIHEYNIENE